FRRLDEVIQTSEFCCFSFLFPFHVNFEVFSTTSPPVNVGKSSGQGVVDGSQETHEYNNNSYINPSFPIYTKWVQTLTSFKHGK
ncbi:hypothetical protein RBK84_00630, partial [Pseudomonas aeruginosa]|uniref:hypothetical protein n=1 Tax=Pseudomonas aeruginosa TaxID=287 RepID=UPI0027D436B8